MNIIPPPTLHLQNPHQVAEVINDFTGNTAPKGGTRENGWFAGYGCRWCDASRAWFTVLPFGHESVAERLAQMFTKAGCKEVVTGYEGGIGPDNGGRGIQISAYV